MARGWSVALLGSLIAGQSPTSAKPEVAPAPSEPTGDDLIGRTVLVGLTYVRSDGSF